MFVVNNTQSTRKHLPNKNNLVINVYSLNYAKTTHKHLPNIKHLINVCSKLRSNYTQTHSK